jgi:hypothetical protein
VQSLWKSVWKFLKKTKNGNNKTYHSVKLQIIIFFKHLKSMDWGNAHENSNQQKAEIAALILDKKEFQTKENFRDEHVHYIMIKNQFSKTL